MYIMIISIAISLTITYLIVRKKKKQGYTNEEIMTELIEKSNGTYWWKHR